MPTPPAPCQNIHASCVSIDGFGILIIGPSGSGKSAFALQLMALGADLVSDDRTTVSFQGSNLFANAPDTIKGMIEARFVGLLTCEFVESTVVSLVIDISLTEKDRLPLTRHYNLLGQSIPLLHKVEIDYFPAAILQIAKSGGLNQTD